MSVLAFSGDDSLVLVTISPWIGGQPIHLATIDLRNNQVLWRYDGPETLGSFLAEPDGTSFAIALKTLPRHVPDDPLSDVLIAHGDGTATQISGRYATTW